jgi:hypothetical protein
MTCPNWAQVEILHGGRKPKTSRIATSQLTGEDIQGIVCRSVGHDRRLDVIGKQEEKEASPPTRVGPEHCIR